MSSPCATRPPSGSPLPPDSNFLLADASDLQGRHLLAGLDKVARDLDRQEKAITAILRPPLEQGRAVQDSAERAKDLKVPPGWSRQGALVLDRDHLSHVTISPE